MSQTFFAFNGLLAKRASRLALDGSARSGAGPVDDYGSPNSVVSDRRSTPGAKARLPISCFIIAKNEGDRIGRTVRSVRDLVDEVIVVDSFSSDDTVKNAQSQGAIVVRNAWRGFGQQKRFAEDLCRNHWLLNIDADEVITDDLGDEISALFAVGNPEFSSYRMPIALVYPGQSKPRPWARDHFCVRLYDRRVVRFRDSTLHDSVVTDGHRVGRILSAVHHHSIRSFDDMRRKLDERMWLAVADSGPQPRWKIIPRLMSEMPMHFFKYYVVRGHFTGGWTGLKYASLQSWYRFKKIQRLWR